MNKEQKKAVLSDLRDCAGRNQAFFLADFRGIKAGKLELLRREMREAGGKCQVVKNSLLEITFRERGLTRFTPLSDQNALFFAFEEPTVIAKIIKKYVDLPAEEGAGLRVKGGYLGERVLSIEEVLQLAQLPSRKELLSKMASSLNAPLYQLVTVLQATVRDFILVLKAIQNKKGSEVNLS